jgi:hypothetical protein
MEALEKKFHARKKGILLQMTFNREDKFDVYVQRKKNQNYNKCKKKIKT